MQTTTGVNVTVNIKDVSVAPTSASVDRNDLCPADGNIVLSYTGGTLGTNATAEWYSDATFTTSVGSGNNLTLATPSDTTTYYVRFEGDCNTTTGVNVTVNIKNVSVAPTSASVDRNDLCPADGNIVLSYSGGTLGTNATAEWYSDATFTTNVGSGNNLTLATPSDTTTYYVRFEGDCNTTAGVNVTVNIKDVSVAPTSASVDRNDLCPADGNIVLSYTGGTLGTNATAEWYSDATFTTSVGSGNNLTIATPSDTTTYYVRFEGDCNTTTGVNVTVNIKDVSIAPTSASVDRNDLCPADGNIVLSYTGGTLGTNATAEWYSDATFTTNVGSGNNLTLVTPSDTTTYYVRFEGDCNTTTGVNVTVNIKDVSVAPTSASVDRNDLCPADGNIVLSYTGGTLGTNATAEWYSDATFTTNVGSGNNLTLATPSDTTTYYVRFEGDCNTTTGVNVTVNIKDVSVAPTSASVDRNDLCPADGNIVLSYAGGTLGTNATAEWYSDATFTTSVGSGNNLTLATPSDTTTYYVRFEGDCNTTSGVNVTVNIKDVSVAPTSASVDRNDLCPADGNIVLSYTGGTLGTNATAEWYSDATFTTNVGSGNNLTLATPSDTTTYYVRFEGDCNTTTGVNVTVNIKNVSVAPTSASGRPQRPLSCRRQHRIELHRRNPWNQRHGRMVLRCHVHNECRIR